MTLHHRAGSGLSHSDHWAIVMAIIWIFLAFFVFRDRELERLGCFAVANVWLAADWIKEQLT